MKIGIIAANDIRFSPYIFFYTRILDCLKYNYEIIYPHRSGIEDTTTQLQTHVITWHDHYGAAAAYTRYAIDVARVINREKYDALIVLTTANAVFLMPYLKRHYRKRYIVDIRDYTHENVKPYYYLEEKALRNAMLNVVSSRRFSRFLPTDNTYCVCHNISSYNSKEIDAGLVNRNKEPICISYIGAGNYLDSCENLIRLVKNDKRFVLKFYGPNTIRQKLVERKVEVEYPNVMFCGPFSQDEKGEIIAESSILYNAYGNGCELLDCALSNKLYDSLIFRKPILVSPDTYMSEMAGPLGYSIELAKVESLDSLYKWYSGVDWEEIDKFAENQMQEITEEHRETAQIIKEKLKHI